MKKKTTSIQNCSMAKDQLAPTNALRGLTTSQIYKEGIFAIRKKQRNMG